MTATPASSDPRDPGEAGPTPPAAGDAARTDSDAPRSESPDRAAPPIGDDEPPTGPRPADVTVAAVDASQEALAAPSLAIAVRESARRRSRFERYRPRPAITLLTFVAGIGIGAAVFVARIEAPLPPQSLPSSPYQSLSGVAAPPFQVAVLMEGLTSTAENMPHVVPDPALGQLERVLEQYAQIISVEHQGTVVVGNQAVSALVLRGFDLQGRTVATTLTARLVDDQIVEFR